MTMAWGMLLAGGADEEVEQSAVAGFLNLNGKPVLSYSLRAMEDCPDLDGVVVVAPKDRLEQVQNQAQLFGCHKLRKIVPGGATYMTSLNQGLAYVDEDVDTLVIHEAASPFLTPAMLSDVLKASRKSGVAVTGAVVTEPMGLLGRNRTLDGLADDAARVRLTAPYAFSLTVLDKATKAAKTKKKRLKSPLDLLPLIKDEVKLAPVDDLPQRIRSVSDLPRLDALVRL